MSMKVIGTPVYFRNVSAQLKTVFDRAYAVRPAKPLEGRFGGAIAAIQLAWSRG